MKTEDVILDLLEIEDGLTKWEVEFIEDVSRLSNWTTKQINKLNELWDKHCS